MKMRKIFRHSKSFVLLEVLIALTILGVTVSAILRSFSQSLSAVRRIEVQTQAAFFAHQLLDEFEINPPDEGTTEGGFGDAYREYSYVATVRYEMPDYGESRVHKDIGQFFPLRLVAIEINYDNGRNAPFQAASIHSAIMGFERFSEQAKKQLMNF